MCSRLMLWIALSWICAPVLRAVDIPILAVVGLHNVSDEHLPRFNEYVENQLYRQYLRRDDVHVPSRALLFEELRRRTLDRTQRFSLGLLPDDPALAADLGRSLSADFILTGRVLEYRIEGRQHEMEMLILLIDVAAEDVAKKWHLDLGGASPDGKKIHRQLFDQAMSQIDQELMALLRKGTSFRPEEAKVTPVVTADSDLRSDGENPDVAWGQTQSPDPKAEREYKGNVGQPAVAASIGKKDVSDLPGRSPPGQENNEPPKRMVILLGEQLEVRCSGACSWRDGHTLVFGDLELRLPRGYERLRVDETWYEVEAGTHPSLDDDLHAFHEIVRSDRADRLALSYAASDSSERLLDLPTPWLVGELIFRCDEVGEKPLRQVVSRFEEIVGLKTIDFRTAKSRLLLDLAAVAHEPAAAGR